MGLYHGLVPSSKDIIIQPTIYRVIAYFSLYYELASDRSKVLDITWDYTMAWFPAQKIIYNGLVPISIDIRAIAMFHMFTNWPQLRMPGPVHSFGYNMELYHGLVPSSQDYKE